MNGVRWKVRGSYGRMIHRTVKRLEQKFQKESTHKKQISLAKTIGYLISVQREIIRDEENSNLEKRVQELEKRYEQNDTINKNI